MKLTIKTLQATTFTVEIEPDRTVKELKDKIEADHGKNYPTSAQKLIYSGKILADESKLSEYEIDEKKFVVLMVTRPPPAPRPPAAEIKQAPAAATGAKKDEQASVKSKASLEDKSKSSTTQSSSSTTTSSTASFASATGTTTPTTTTPNTITTQQSAAGNRSTSRSSDAAMAAAMSAAPYMDSRLAALMSQPQFRQIQDLIQQSPHLLSSTIEALAGSDPEMHRFISENPDVFVNALNHPPMAGSRTQSSRSSTTTTTSGQSRQNSQQQAAGGARNPAAGGRQQSGVDQILVSENDKQAIERLKELGFSEYLAVQAYMACDKDEQLAANLLFQMDQ